MKELEREGSEKMAYEILRRILSDMPVEQKQETIRDVLSQMSKEERQKIIEQL
jgi:hypothetical protein